MNSLEHLFDERIAKQKDQIIQRQEELISSLQQTIKQRDEKIESVTEIIDYVLEDPSPDALLILAKTNHVLKS